MAGGAGLGITGRRPGTEDGAAGWREAGLLADPGWTSAYRDHHGAVLALARRLTGDPAVAADISHDVFVRLWERPGAFDPDRGPLRSYLMAQCRSRAIDVLRSETARQRREQREAPAPALVDGVEAQAERQAVGRAVVGALAVLPPWERQAIVLAYYGRNSYTEVATLLGLPEGTVKSRIRAGLRRLRRSLRAEGPEAAD